MTSWIVTIPDHLKTQEMCDEAVRTNSLSLVYVPDRFKTQEGWRFTKRHCYIQLLARACVDLSRSR